MNLCRVYTNDTWMNIEETKLEKEKKRQEKKINIFATKINWKNVNQKNKTKKVYLTTIWSINICIKSIKKILSQLGNTT